LAPRLQREVAAVILAAAVILEVAAAGIPAVEAAHISQPLIFQRPVAAAHLISPLALRLTLVEAARIFQCPTAAAHLISPLALRLTLVEAARIFPPAYLTADLLLTPRLTVLRLRQRIML
jgi:hypothetical protein